MRLDGVKKVSHPTNAGALVTHDPFFGKFRLVLSERAEKLQSHLFVKGSLLYLYSQPVEGVHLLEIKKQPGFS